MPEIICKTQRVQRLIRYDSCPQGTWKSVVEKGTAEPQGSIESDDQTSGQVGGIKW